MASTSKLLAKIDGSPSRPKSYRPEIGLIGCGGITEHHLAAYKSAGFNVTALCDIDIAKARDRAQGYFPEAAVFESYSDLLALDTIEVVDIATHPIGRAQIIRYALMHRKHVLSQKPFVLDLTIGQQLVDLADSQGCYLAVNQNARWAPHFGFGKAAIETGVLGQVYAVHMGCHWDHTWVAGTEFENVKHLVLYDYAIHWFDMVRCYLGGAKAKRVFASNARAPGQTLRPALLGQALIEFEGAQSSLRFDAAVRHGPLEETFVAGTEGTFRSTGTGNQDQTASIVVDGGCWTPTLTGKWFPDGFRGTMGELLCAIEEKRECQIQASDNLHSLALCFAAIESAETGKPVVPGSTTRLPS